MGICSQTSKYPGPGAGVNNPLKNKLISCRFRAKMALLDNLAARQGAL
jgi:hypothetical protein